MGSADAPVKVVEFFDVACPYCRKFHNGIFKALYTTFDTSKVAFYFRPFPISRKSVKPLRSLYYAETQGEFPSLLEFLYTFQPRSWTPKTFYYISEATDLDPEALFKAAHDSTYSRLVTRSYRSAQDAGVRGTPTIFINGRKISKHSLNKSCIKKTIRSELGSSTPAEASQ